LKKLPKIIDNFNQKATEEIQLEFSINKKFQHVIELLTCARFRSVTNQTKNKLVKNFNSQTKIKIEKNSLNR